MPLSLIPLGQLLSDFTHPTYVNFQSKVQRTGGKDTELYVIGEGVLEGYEALSNACRSSVFK
jgi:hypothetical protein